MAATPLQLAVGYAHVRQRRLGAHAAGRAGDLRPRDARRRARLRRPRRQATVVQRIAPQSRQIPMAPALREPIVAGLRRNITGPGANGRSTTAEELFADYPADAIQVAGKTGTAQGPQLPVERLLGVRRLQRRARAARTPSCRTWRRPGSARTGAAPVVKCMFLALSGYIPLDPVPISEPLDTSSEQVPTTYPRRHQLHAQLGARDHPPGGLMLRPPSASLGGCSKGALRDPPSIWSDPAPPVRPGTWCGRRPLLRARPNGESERSERTNEVEELVTCVRKSSRYLDRCRTIGWERVVVRRRSWC